MDDVETLAEVMDATTDELSRRAYLPAEGDYVGDDGLLHCGRCGERKQRWFEVPAMGIRKLVYMRCPCQREADDAREARRAEQQRMHDLQELRRASLMDKRFRDSTFDRFIVTDWNRALYLDAKAYAEHFDRMLANNNGLLLIGDTGCGKSFTAACIANYLLERMVPVVVTGFVKLLSIIKPYGREDESEEYIIRTMGEASLLVIDDLGAEAGTPTQLARIYNIIDSRYRAGKPLIVTTNLTMAELNAATDIDRRRIYERIMETCYPLEFPGKSWRMAAAQTRFVQMSQLFEQAQREGTT